jgi:glycosyltransferase involved in cell wall biosynthesis
VTVFQVGSEIMRAKISVIIPIYNAEAFLVRCLESVLQQTFREIEIICVNDGSSDRSGEILALYQAQDSRLTILEQENEGTAVARNKGLLKAVGDYIYYLDSDDVMHPQLLEYAYTLAVTRNADLVCFEWVNLEHDHMPSRLPLEDFNRYPVCCPKTPLLYLKQKGDFRIGFNVWSKLYRRALVEKACFLPGNCVEDIYHTACVLRDDPKTVISKAPLYFYRLRHDSVSGIPCTIAKINDYHESLLSIVQYYREAPDLIRGKSQLDWLKRSLIQIVLKQQYNQLLRHPATTRKPSVERFRAELIDLRHKGLLAGKDFTLKYYLKYYLRYLWLLAGRPL